MGAKMPDISSLMAGGANSAAAGQSQANQADAGMIQNATALATQANQVQQSNNMLQAQQTQLAQMKWDHASSLLRNFSSMPKQYQDLASDTIKDQLRKAGTPMDNFVDMVHQDPDLSSKVQTMLNDPNTSSAMRGQGQILLKQLSLDPFGAADKVQDWAKSASQQTAGVAEKQVLGNIMGQRMDNQSDKNVMAENNRITKDPIVMKARNSLDNMRNDLATVRGGLEKDDQGNIKGLDPSVFTEIATNYAKTLSGAAASSESQRDKLELNNASTKLTDLVNKFRTSGRSKVDDPALISGLQDQLERMQQYQGDMLNRSLEAKRVNYKNPSMTDAQEQTINEVKSQYGLGNKAAPAQQRAQSSSPASEAQQIGFQAPPSNQGSPDNDNVLRIIKAYSQARQHPGPFDLQKFKSAALNNFVPADVDSALQYMNDDANQQGTSGTSYTPTVLRKNPSIVRGGR